MNEAFQDPQTLSQQVLDNIDNILSPQKLFNSLFFRICRMIAEVHSYPTVLNLLDQIFYVIQVFQIMLLSLFSNSHGIWVKDPSTILYSDIINIIIRFLPFHSSHDAHSLAIIFIILLHATVIFYLIWTFLFYKPFTSCTYTTTKWLPILPFYLTKIMVIPCVCHFFWCVYNVRNGVAVGLLIISLINCVISIAGYITHNMINSCFPVFSSNHTAKWFNASYSFNLISILVSAALYETLEVIISKEGRLIIMTLLNLSTFVKLCYSGIYCPFTKIRSNFYFVYINIMNLINGLSITACDYLDYHFSVWLIVCISALIPLMFISKQIVKRRIIKLKTICDYCVDNVDFKPLQNLTKMSIVTAICTSFNGDFDALNWLMEYYPQDFSVITLYYKFVLLFPKQHHLLKQSITQMKPLCHLSIQNKIITCYFEYLYFINCSDPFEVDSFTSLAVDDYLMTLHLFWTEVLLGRKKRLLSLSQVVNEKYLYAQSFFHLFEHAYEKLENYERFRSISSLQLVSLVSKESEPIMNIIYRESKNSVPSAVQSILSKSNSINRYPRSLPIEQVAADIKKKTLLFRHLVMYYPFIFIVSVGIILTVFLFINCEKIPMIWDYEFSIIDIIYRLIVAYFLYPLIPLTQNGIYDSSMFKNYINENHLFNTNLTDVKNDLISIIDSAVEMFPQLYQNMKTHPFPEGKGELLTTKYSIYMYPKTSNTTKNVSFIMMLNYLTYIAKSHAQTFTEQEFIDIYSTNMSASITRSNIVLFNSALTFLYNYPPSVENIILNFFSKRACYFEISATILIFLAFVMQLCSGFLALYFIEAFFDNLFILPKVSISELIDKLGSRISTNFLFHEEIDSDLKYNLTQLSYQSAPKSFESLLSSFTLFSILTFLMAIIFRGLFIPGTYENQHLLKFSFKNLKMASPHLSLPIYFSVVQHDALELLLISKLGLEPPANYTQVLFNSINDTTHYIISDLYNYTIDADTFPPFLLRSFFLTPNLTIQDPIDSQTIPVIGAFMIATNLLFLEEFRNNQTFTPSTLNNMVASTISIMNKMIPALRDSLMNSIQSFIGEFRYTATIIVYIYFFLTLMTMVVVHYLAGTMLNDPDFVVSFLSTVPPNVLTNFTRGNNDFSEGQTEVAPMIFENEDAFQFLVETVILCDSLNNVVAITPSGQAMLQLDEYLIKFTDLLSTLKISIDQLKLPPTEQFSQPCMAVFPSGEEKVLKIFITPVKKFIFNTQLIEYACTIEDITQKHNLIYNLNHEANKVRLLMTQYVPWPIADLFSRGENAQRIVVQKIICMNFYLKTPLPLTFHELSIVQAELNKLMKECSFLTYFGRSLQSFRVVSGIFNTSMPLPEQAARSVIFSMQLIEIIRHISENIHKPIDVHCGVHAPGPVCADEVSQNPPIFDVFGHSLTVSETVSMKCDVNKINITRDVYELIFGQSSFEIAFETEISLLNGAVMPIHMVTHVNLE
ncbi:hypothetical protein TRFO_10789 [Tritrichomonas foetus]|uniref:Guanylate cyclase domain-containing protein n=1 Tax=Tritrichomonas foetus TaxID=1144522 RepID=A0A1J4JB33_9EUKA|nr:hypothetical protein TRFO_10789 [Tritrichomonas foetus]|eukprot:OHS94867.1 hypothetical protein TRFO_10789 [Tritrichomonas foetus]